MTRPIRWDLIEQNYDQMIKFATAVRVGTASAEAVLRRFTRNASHPVYQAMLELGMIALHILQAAIVYVNTLMVQEVLALPEWEGVLTAEDRLGLTPLFWSHILPYGEVRLNMATRLALGGPQSGSDQAGLGIETAPGDLDG